jgi:hypothetical protein
LGKVEDLKLGRCSHWRLARLRREERRVLISGGRDDCPAEAQHNVCPFGYDEATD